MGISNLSIVFQRFYVLRATSKRFFIATYNAHLQN